MSNIQGVWKSKSVENMPEGDGYAPLTVFWAFNAEAGLDRIRSDLAGATRSSYTLC